VPGALTVDIGAAVPEIRCMDHQGGCHCGNIHVRLRLSKPPADNPLRACTCSFCRSHSLRMGISERSAGMADQREFKIGVLAGDGIGPEITDATIEVLRPTIGSVNASLGSRSA